MTKQVADDRPARFVAELHRLERGPLAQLRRGLGGDERGVYWLEGLYTRTGYGEADPYQKEALRLVAGLYALKPQARQDEGDAAEVEMPELAASADPEKGPSTGLLMGRLYLAQGERPSTEKRFLALLDADRDGLNYQMRQAVTLLAAGDLTPDWVRLTRDLLYWGDRVRREWAQDFYREISREVKDTAPFSDDATPTPQGAQQ
ncbi:type I-E CRISPR-associated protein Cse2/CasB [Deinococcus sp. MIMF12]|uniref:Type I-E CRISPR-associated protein Cse2/CasB n=1 Tax=Deinococcus rhizophilus TaxID=3049544 RepID=A0ABT7JGH3_9DEIO|nr:type I-E CRISPR-associated protein Cse2/CasB [Deinococcus rhizophilus]MDL2344051.1 type I-E CRISPR-associated protein Cse2/CasB [Deinococcus rhizophilus]